MLPVGTSRATPAEDVMSEIIETPEKYYKVLVNGKSCHGGEFTWSLPTDDQPGEWNEVAGEGKILLCSRGLHVTTNPAHWWKDGCVVYEAEIDGEIGGVNKEKCKIVVPKVRLIRALNSIVVDKVWKIIQDESKSSGWSDPVKV